MALPREKKQLRGYIAGEKDKFTYCLVRVACRGLLDVQDSAGGTATLEGE